MKKFWWRARVAVEWLRERTPWKHKNNLTKERPPGWSKASLGSFLELMWSNAIATHANLGDGKRVRDIDTLLDHFVKNLSRVKNKAAVGVGLPLLMIIRAHAAYRAAASLTLGGSIPEAMAVLRLCLETAGYASLIQGNEALAIVWLQRGDNAEAKQKARSEFTYGKVRRALELRNERVAAHFDSLYQYLIDAGAHPNERGLMRSLELHLPEDGGLRITQIYLQDDPTELERGLRSLGQIGVCALMIFEIMYPDECRELGITEGIGIVSKGL